jgi:hypothetical protein
VLSWGDWESARECTLFQTGMRISSTIQLPAVPAFQQQPPPDNNHPLKPLPPFAVAAHLLYGDGGGRELPFCPNLS